MSIPDYKPKTRPALWLSTAGGLKPRSMNVRPEIQRQKRQAKLDDAFRKSRIRAARRKPVRSRSAAMSSKMVIYNRRKAEFLRERPYCFACKQLAGAISRMNFTAAGLSRFQFQNAIAFRDLTDQRNHSADQIHHRFGRAGNLLLNKSGWVGVCGRAHHFITDNPVVAREAGLLCQPGEWGRL